MSDRSSQYRKALDHTVARFANRLYVSAVTDANNDGLLGRLAVHYKLVTLDQLSAITTLQARMGSDQPLGQLLIAKGLLSAQQLEQLIKIQRDYVAKQAAVQAKAAPVTGSNHGGDGSVGAQHAAPSEPRAIHREQPQQSAPAVTSAPVAAPIAPAPTKPAIAVQSGASPVASLLTRAVNEGASDVHLHSGAAVRFRVNGAMRDVGEGSLSKDAAEGMVRSILSSEQLAVLAEKGQVDFAYTLKGVGRFRGNAYRQQRGTDMVLRAIPALPPTLTQLGLPSSLARFTNFHQGMVLLTGPAGCGKSSTLAALVNIINEERRDHIITVEDPIEYVHAPKRCSVNQRQVGPHTASFARALRAALREDPDIIAIGELRDLETISLALTAAETGHLVLATLHTNNAIRTVNRLLGAFPPEQQNQIRTMVSESLRAIVSQRLIPRADGKGRALALEILVVNKAVGNLIRENKTFQIRSSMQTGQSLGMVLLDDSLRELVKSGIITREEAMKNAEEPAKLKG